METWCTIDSDPGVFTDMISQMGVKGLQVEELYSLDKAAFAGLQPVYGLIFLFRWAPDAGLEPGAKKAKSEADSEAYGDLAYPNVYFAKQVINNACATQAILNILMNIRGNEKVDLGKELTEFREFTKDMPSEMKGLAILNSSTIRNAHNSFSVADRVSFEKPDDEPDTDEDEDVFHFTAYVPVDGAVYELDGLKSGPVFLGNCATGADWLDTALPAIQEKIGRYKQNEIHFNLMAVVRNRKMALEEEIARIKAKKDALGQEAAEAAIKELDTELEIKHEMLAEEERKAEKWKKESLRRKFDYFPFVTNLLKALAESGDLEALLNDAIKEQEQNQNKDQEKQNDAK